MAKLVSEVAGSRVFQMQEYSSRFRRVQFVNFFLADFALLLYGQDILCLDADGALLDAALLAAVAALGNRETISGFQRQ